MWLTGLLQSLEPVLPPIARTWNVYVVPGINPVTITAREFVNIPVLTQSPVPLRGVPPASLHARTITGEIALPCPNSTSAFTAIA